MVTYAVVIVHRNQPDSCQRTVAAFRDQSVPVEIVVVDNASRPGALEEVRGIDPPVRLIELDENLGFGPTANVGLLAWLEGEFCPDADWVFVAPHDALASDGTLGALLAAGVAEQSAGILSADVGDQARPIVDRFFGAMPGRALGYAGFEPADYPHGTLFGIRRACLADTGGFDERYFAYGEEADLGLRAKGLGWQVGIVRDAMVANPTTSGATAIVEYLKHRNTLLLLRDHAGRWPVFVRSVTLVGQLVGAALFAKRRPPWFHARARRLALWDYLRGRFGPPPAELN